MTRMRRWLTAAPNHYYFWIYALDDDLALEPRVDRRARFDRIEDRVIEQARVLGIHANDG
jgi:phosphatidylethanolamine-binding protein (PEBP) family uncharacterized protein